MDTSKKIIRGVVNSRGFTITSPITQWDYGWQFIPEIEELPPTYRLDFSNEEKHGTALPVYCSTEGAEVPTELIDTGKDVWVWYVAIGDGYGITEYKWRIPNKCKPKTEQDEPTPSQQSSIDQLIVRSNEAVTSAEHSAESAQENADFLRNASATATTLSPESEATVTLNEGEFTFGIPKGKDGRNGTDGTDGISPSVSVTDITGGHRVVITDKYGTKSFDVEDGDDYILTEEDKQEIADMVEVPSDYLKAFPTDIASGAVASFSDGADGLPLKSLIVDIEPSQSGSGDPSPTNIRPISGWDAVNVISTGKNVCGELEIGSWRESSPVGSAYEDIKYTAPKRARSVSLVPVTYPMTISIASGYKYALIVFDENKEYLGASSFMNWQSTPYTRTSAWYGNGAYIAFVIKREDEAYITAQDLENCHLQLELGSTATPYEPYAGTSLTISLDQTVYSGKLDVVSGELTVYPYYASYNGESLTGEWISDRDKYVAGTTPTIGAQVVNIGAEGTEYPLDPHEAASLLGQNNIFADTGDIEVEYRADPDLYIQRKMPDIPVDDVQINGTSIVQDGVANIPMPKTVNVSGTTLTITAQADTRYVCGEVATLDFTPSATGICDVVFTSGSTPTVVTLPSTVKFPDGAFTAEANTTYEINILDGVYGVVMAWT